MFCTGWKKKKPETPGRLCLAVDTRYQTSHGRCVTAWRTGSQDAGRHRSFSFDVGGRIEAGCSGWAGLLVGPPSWGFPDGSSSPWCGEMALGWIKPPPRAAVVDSTGSLANGCWRRQLEIRREKIQHKENSSQPTPGKKELPGESKGRAGSSELKGAWAGQVSPSRTSVFSPEKWVTATWLASLAGLINCTKCGLTQYTGSEIRSMAKPSRPVLWICWMVGLGEKFKLIQRAFTRP